VFGIALLLLAGVLGWRVWVSHTGSPISKVILLLLSLLVAICGILCFVVDTAHIANQPASKKVRNKFHAISNHRPLISSFYFIFFLTTLNLIVNIVLLDYQLF
jgi:membrane-bound metal-dependent hydrolase YbcI (DUF457 family)